MKLIEPEVGEWWVLVADGEANLQPHLVVEVSNGYVIAFSASSELPGFDGNTWRGTINQFISMFIVMGEWPCKA